MIQRATDDTPPVGTAPLVGLSHLMRLLDPAGSNHGEPPVAPVPESAGTAGTTPVPAPPRLGLGAPVPRIPEVQRSVAAPTAPSTTPASTLSPSMPPSVGPAPAPAPATPPAVAPTPTALRLTQPPSLPGGSPVAAGAAPPPAGMPMIQRLPAPVSSPVERETTGTQPDPVDVDGTAVSLLGPRGDQRRGVTASAAATDRRDRPAPARGTGHAGGVAVSNSRGAAAGHRQSRPSASERAVPGQLRGRARQRRTTKRSVAGDSDHSSAVRSRDHRRPGPAGRRPVPLAGFAAGSRS